MSHFIADWKVSKGEYEGMHVFTFVDSEKWSYGRETKIQGYIEITYGVKVELGSWSPDNGIEPAYYTFVVQSGNNDESDTRSSKHSNSKS